MAAGSTVGTKAICLADGTGCPSSGVSGMTAGYIPLAASATTITGSSHLDDGITVYGGITSSEPFNVDYSSATRTSADIVNQTGHAWFLNSTGSSGYASAPANSLAFQDGTGMATPLYLTASSVVALQPVSMPTGSTVNSTAICLADGTGGGYCGSAIPIYTTSGTLVTGYHSVAGAGFTSGSSTTFTFSGAAAFTSSGTYSCLYGTTTTAYAVALSYTPTSGTSVTFSSTVPSFQVDFTCTGY